jgi:hypothetical protein
MNDDEKEYFQPTYLTISDIWGMYRRAADRPLDEGMIQATLTPLAGTSFFKRITEALAELPDRQPSAIDLYSPLYGLVFEWNDDPKRTNEAARCLFHLTGRNIPLDNVHGLRWMEADELLFWEHRHDWLYHDYERSRVAGSHTASQLRFYKSGTLRGIIPFSILDYEEPEQPFRYFHHVTIAEGIIDHTFFNDQKQRPFLSLDPRQSLFRTSLPSVYISPDFSFDKARGK